MSNYQLNKPTNNNQEHFNEFLIFQLSKQLYAIHILYIKEIIEYMPLSGTQQFNKNELFSPIGLIQLRNDIITIIDMRKSFSQTSEETSNQTVIIIIQVKNKLFGLIVDSVFDVHIPKPNEIQESPNFAKPEDKLISHILDKDQKMVSVIDIYKFFKKFNYEFEEDFLNVQ